MLYTANNGNGQYHSNRFITYNNIIFLIFQYSDNAVHIAMLYEQRELLLYK